MSISFLNPGALLLLLLLPLLGVFFVWRQLVQQRRLLRLGDLDLVRPPMDRQQGRAGTFRSSIWLLACVCVVVALARPVWGVNTDVVEVQGVSVVVVLDVSNSMGAQDLLPSRLERAKLGLYGLFDGLRGNEVGLVVFAGTAFIQFPLTTDIDSATAFLNAVDSGSITQQGTVIDEALHLALGMFDEQRPSGRLIVLVTDGENQEGDVQPAVDEAVQKGVTIDTLGYGSVEGAPVPIFSDSGEIVAYKADSSGQMVVSRLDEPLLQHIAEQTGGLYQRGGASGAEITNLVRVINQAETGLLDNRVEARSVERYELFVLAAAILLAVEMLLVRFRRQGV
ncbi:MAG: VWA domain-containing protein [Anaerolineae bacterium]|nr:VWA domain-containing protein [Anaerolineae bacterium]